MADPIYINISNAAEGAALARAIGRYGLSAGLVRSDTRWQVEISSPREDPRTFLTDVGVALAAANGGGRAGSASRGSP
jgi:hypothetical protein